MCITKSEISMRRWQSYMRAASQDAFVDIPEISQAIFPTQANPRVLPSSRSPAGLVLFIVYNSTTSFNDEGVLDKLVSLSLYCSYLVWLYIASTSAFFLGIHSFSCSGVAKDTRIWITKVASNTQALISIENGQVHNPE